MDWLKTQKIGLKINGKKQDSWGQITLEFIMLLSLVLILTRFVFNQVRERGLLDEFVSGPNPIISHMLENGVWSLSREEAQANHPNQFERHYSWEAPTQP